ncbi:RidA family protein [Geminicoccaceae bacterium 1502E]|nr:RidA family protein [Geminicoccaceae bacterium 1502E]
MSPQTLVLPGATLMRRHFSPPSLPAPFGRYHHAALAEGPQRLLVLSGQLGIRADGTIPEDVEAQTRLVLEAIDACLAEAGMERRHVLRLTTYLTEIDYRLAYMKVRDAWVADPAPASTLLVVKALAQPACKVEIEAIAAA